MPFIAALMALGWSGHVAPPVQAPGITMFGHAVPVEAPKPAPTEYSAEVKSWSGWSSLGSTFPTPFLVDGDWSTVVTAAAALKPDPATVPWRVRVFLLPSVDLLCRTPAGNLEERRTSINGPCRTRIEQGLALAAAAVQVQSGGRLAVSYDTSTDTELYEEQVAQGEGLGPGAIQAYLGPRINGGSFEANDKVFRGPYNACLVIHAGLTDEAQVNVNGTPVAALSAALADQSVSAFTQRLLEEFQVAVDAAAERYGRFSKPGVPLRVDAAPHESAAGALRHSIANVFGGLAPDDIANEASLGPVAGDVYVKGFRVGREPQPMPTSGPFCLEPSPLTGNATVEIGSDPDKGSILTLKLTGLFPNGGFGLPMAKDFSGVLAGSNHFLVFDVRTNSHEALGVGPIVGGDPDGPGISLGPRSDPGLQAALPPDGAWHRVAVDLRQVCKEGESGGVYIGVLPKARRQARGSMLSTAYDFANFALVPAPPAGVLEITQSAGPSWDAAASAARSAAKSAGTPEGATSVVQILEDPDETMRLNALDALATVKAPALEEQIASGMGNINPRVTEAAVAALAFQDTPTAWATLRKAVSIGPGTHTKAVAATFVGPRQDAATAGPISALQGTAKNWHDRALAAKALAACGLPQALIFLYGSLSDDDPGVRLIATDLIATMDDAGMHRLMFASVNDASDAVRAEACIKLLQSSSAEVRQEGYRGASDDSWWVRVQVLNWIATHPSANDRPALRQAVTSPYPEVRAAALRAFSASPDPVTLDELGGVLHDLHPMVQRELLAVAKSKNLTLPAETLDALKASVAPDVASAAASLGKS